MTDFERGLNRDDFIKWAKGFLRIELDRSNHHYLGSNVEESRFHDGRFNAFLQCLRMLGVSEDEINKAREEYSDGRNQNIRKR